MKATIVVPIYNETKSLPKFLEIIENAKSKNLHYLIVDNGSSEIEVSRILSRSSQYWTQIRTEANLGFGGGILFGINACDSEVVGWMPGNLKVDPQEVGLTLQDLKISENQMIKASRSGRTHSAVFKTRLAGFIQSTLLRVNMFDSGGTPTVCFKSFVLGLNSPPTDYVFESFILYSARTRGMEVLRPEITYGQRKYGESHWQRGLRSEIALMKKIWTASKSWKK